MFGLSAVGSGLPCIQRNMKQTEEINEAAQRIKHRISQVQAAPSGTSFPTPLLAITHRTGTTDHINLRSQFLGSSCSYAREFSWRSLSITIVLHMPISTGAAR